MAAKLKTKITLGVVFLFTLFLLVGGTSFYYLNKTITRNITITPRISVFIIQF